LYPVFYDQEKASSGEKTFLGFLLLGVIIVFVILFIYIFRIVFQGPVKSPKHSFKVTIITAIGLMVMFLISHYMPIEPEKEKPEIADEESGKAAQNRKIPADIEEIEKNARTETETIPKEVFLFLGGVLFFLLIVRSGMKMKSKKEFSEAKKLYTEIEIPKNEAVIEYYKKAVLLLNKKGIPYKDSFTHWEIENIVEKKERENIIKNFTELTKLFEKSKYSPENINEKDVKRAEELYENIKRMVSEYA